MGIAFPEPGVGRRPEQPDDWLRGHTDGSMREIHTLIRLVPGGREAVRDYVRAYPGTTFANAVTA